MTIGRSDPLPCMCVSLSREASKWRPLLEASGFEGEVPARGQRPGGLGPFGGCFQSHHAYTELAARIAARITVRATHASTNEDVVVRSANTMAATRQRPVKATIITKPVRGDIQRSARPLVMGDRLSTRRPAAPSGSDPLVRLQDPRLHVSFRLRVQPF